MKPLFHRLGLAWAALVAGSLGLYAQGLPTEQPKLLTIVREQVKVGRAAQHAKHEAGWPAAYEKANSPDYYLALTSMTGSPEALYLIPRASFAADAETMKREDKDPVLTAELARLAEHDAEFLTGVTTLQAVARPDLSVGTFPDVTKARFFQIGMYQVRPRKSEQFDTLARLYGKIRARVSPKSSYRVYSVIAGMPTPTYLIISSVEDYGKFDDLMSEDLATFTSLTAEERAQFSGFSELVAKEEFNFYRVDPLQSYVPRAVREKDADFWMPK